MINPFEEINWRPDRGDIKIFGRTLIIGGAILLSIATLYLFLCTAPAQAANVFQMIFAMIIVIGVIAYLIPGISKPFYLVWFFVGACMGTVVSNLIFLLFYYLFFTPIAWVVRVSGRDPLALRRRADDSLWEAHKEVDDPKRYYRQY